jgi:SAM-dependent methyltransferase
MSAAEMSRVLSQDRLLTQQMGGLLAEQDPARLTALTTVLDVACGPGGWVLDMAFAYPQAQIIGFDISEPMVRYARTQARELGSANVDFRVMDATKPLDFPDSSFDLVNARLVSTFMPTRVWPAFLRESLRLLRPGGTMRVTDLEFAMSNSPGHERMCSLWIQAMMRGGLSFSPDGRHLCLLTMLGRLLEEAGVQNIQRKPYLVDCSIGAEVHNAWSRDLLQGWQLGKPYVVRQQVVTAEEFDQTYTQCLREMHLENFCAIWFLATFWGTKPLQP